MKPTSDPQSASKNPARRVVESACPSLPNKAERVHGSIGPSQGPSSNSGARIVEEFMARYRKSTEDKPHAARAQFNVYNMPSPAFPKPFLDSRSTNETAEPSSSLSPACTQHLTMIHQLTQDKSALLKKMEENDEQKRKSEADLLIEKRLRREHQQGEDWAKNELKAKTALVFRLENDVRKQEAKIRELEKESRKRKAVELENEKEKKFRFSFDVEVKVNGESVDGVMMSGGK